MLSPQVKEINVRFDCKGKNDDTWWFKDLFVRLALEDLTDPTVLTDQITVDTGPHAYGNEFIISLPFNEAVKYEPEGVYYLLHTTWGNALLETTSNYTNILTFRGTINAPVGTVLTINGFSINSQFGDFYVTDLSDRKFNGNISKTFNQLKVGESYDYPINYVLNGGTLSGNYPTSYSYTSGIVTLPIPTNGNYGFAGWYDNDQFTGASIATIPTGSKGARTFYAKWVDDFEPYASGTVDDPYIIDNTMRLDLLATRVNAGNSYSGKYFKLEADITYTHGTGDSEHNYTAIGIAQKNFSGHFDGNGHTIKGIRIYKTKDNFYGVFGILGKGGSIRNLILDDSKISGDSYIGGIVGLNYGTIENCAVTNSVYIRTLEWGSFYHGGISGYNQGTISGCSSAAQFDIKSEANKGNYDYGGIVGFNYENAIVQNCVAWGATIPANRGITHYGAICGANDVVNDAANGVLVNNVYSSACDINGKNSNVGCDGIDTNGARRARDIRAGTGVTITPADAATEYNVSNITAYGTGSLYYRGYIRSANTQTVHLTLGHNRPGYTFEEYGVDYGTLSGDDTEGYTLTVADHNATISATWTSWCSFCFGSVSSFFLALFLHSSPIAFWAPTD